MNRLITLSALVATLVLGGSVALAGECTSGLCGTPQQSGGGCGCGCGGSILVNMTDRGLTYQFADDFDGDGIEDEFDNCPFKANVDQLDSDGDGVGDACDLCPNTYDPEQGDVDGDGIGDACDDDMDGDGIPDKPLPSQDNCPKVYNPNQQNSMGGTLGDACNPDFVAACNTNPNAPGCLNDSDGDGVPDGTDNCPTVANPDQADLDGDGIGDACDDDIDGDGVPNYRDNCPTVPNANQVDLDHDGLGDNGNWSGGPGSCDPEQCYYAYLGAPGPCLTPEGAFAVDLVPTIPAPRKDATFQVGDKITLNLLTNRLDDIHQWSSSLDTVPSGSDALLAHGQGVASTLPLTNAVANCDRFDQSGQCAETNAIVFQPDQPGRYVIRLTADLRDYAEDPLGLGPKVASKTLTIEVGGHAASGCTAVGGTGAALTAILIAIGFVLRRRRDA